MWHGRKSLLRLRHHERDIDAIDRAICGNGAPTIESRQPVTHRGEDSFRPGVFFSQSQRLRVRGQGLFIEAFAGRGAESRSLVQLRVQIPQPLLRFDLIVGAYRVLGSANLLYPLWMERLEEDICGRWPLFTQPLQLVGAHFPAAGGYLQPVVRGGQPLFHVGKIDCYAPAADIAGP